MTVLDVEEQGLTRGQSLRRPGVLAWLRLARVYQKVQRAATEQVRAHGLSLGQFDVLATVGARDGLTQQELADRLLVTKGNVCQLLDKMERDGLLVRRQEGRANRLHLTTKGMGIYNEVVPRHEECIAQRLSPLTREEQVQLLALLSKLDSALG